MIRQNQTAVAEKILENATPTADELDDSEPM